jgi:iron complex outermembrane receptor protein
MNCHATSRLRFFLSHFLLLLLSCSFIFAQIKPDTTRVTVTATRSALSVQEAPFRVEIFDAKDIQQSGRTNLAELLAQRSDVFIKQYGSSGLASMSLRGTGAAQTLILLDGFRLNDPQLGQLDVSLLPLAMMQQVEVLHGSSSALYGSDAMGGAVQLHSLSWQSGEQEAPFSGNVTGRFGAFGEQKRILDMRWQGKSLAFQWMKSTSKAQNDFPYWDKGFVPAQRLTRQNADRSDASQMASMMAKLGQHALTAHIWQVKANRGLATPAGSVASGERQNDRTMRYWFTDDWQLRRVRLHLGGMFSEGEIQYQNPQINVDDTGKTHVAHFMAEAQSVLSLRAWLNLGASLEQARAEHPNLAHNAQEQHISGYANGIYKLRNLHIFPALRLDRYQQQIPRTILSPNLGANLDIQPKKLRSALNLKFSIGRAFRAPTLNDRFWVQGGNPDLLPEDGFQTDLGAIWSVQHPKIQVEISGFLNKIQNQIVWQPTAQGFWSPTNVQRVRTRGIELSGNHTFEAVSMRFDQGISAHFTQAQDRSDPNSTAFNKQLRYVPRSQIKAFADISTIPNVSSRTWGLHVAARLIGKRFTTTDESRFLAPFAVADVALRMQQWIAPIHFPKSIHAQNTESKNQEPKNKEPKNKGAKIHLSALLMLENAFNADYAVLENMPMPPRYIKFELQLSFKSTSKNP